MSNRFKKLNAAGDTIIEVLIVLAVLGLALSISYATANKGLQQSRNAQEHSEALGILSSQVELVRSAFAKQAGSTLPAAPFCLAPPTSTPASVTPLGTGSSGFQDVGTDNLNTTAYPGACSQSNLYYVSIVNRGSGLFDFRVRWDGLGQLGRQQEELTYKIGTIAAGGGGYADPESPPPPPLSGSLNVAVNAIAPAFNNHTPSCATPATQLKNGTTVRLTDTTTGTFISSRATAVNSIATFTGIQQGDRFSATVSRSGYGVCPPSPSSGVASATAPVPFTNPNPQVIYPICSSTYHSSGHWTPTNRRTDLDGYYYTIPPAVANGAYPGAYSNFYTGNVRAAGTFYYLWSGDSSRGGEGLLYYWIWEAGWVDTSYTSHDCPDAATITTPGYSP